MQDIIQTVFASDLCEEIFKPQPIYSHEEMKGLFVKLAHSSIMKLNPNSMAKLYDLMVMGWKYSLFNATSPSDLLTITHRHVFEVEKMAQSFHHVEPLLTSIKSQLNQVLKCLEIDLMNL